MPRQVSETGRSKKMNEWTCWVCLDDNACLNNKLIKCDGSCKVVVHQLCYGVETVPTGAWKCDRCSNDPRRSSLLKCALCPVLEGPLKPTENGEWCHVVCALFVPDVTFANESRMSPITITNVTKMDSSCSLCLARGDYDAAKSGVCIKCNEPECTDMFHVGCAWHAELLVELELSSSARGEKGRSTLQRCSYVAYCNTHYDTALEAHSKGGYIVRRYQVQPPESDTSMTSVTSPVSQTVSAGRSSLPGVPGRRPRGRPRRVNSLQGTIHNVPQQAPVPNVRKQEDDQKCESVGVGQRKSAKRHLSANDEPEAKRNCTAVNGSTKQSHRIPVSSQQNLSARLPRPRLVFEPTSSRTAASPVYTSNYSMATVQKTDAPERYSKVGNGVDDTLRANGTLQTVSETALFTNQRGVASQSFMDDARSTVSLGSALQMHVSNISSTASLSSNTATAAIVPLHIIRNDSDLATQLDELATHTSDSLFERQYVMSKHYYDRVMHFVEHADDEDYTEESADCTPLVDGTNRRGPSTGYVRLSFVEFLTFLCKIDEREAWLASENERLERQLRELTTQQEQLCAQTRLFIPSGHAMQLPLQLPVGISGATAVTPFRLVTDEPNNNDKLASTAAYNGNRSPNADYPAAVSRR